LCVDFAPGSWDKSGSDAGGEGQVFAAIEADDHGVEWIDGAAERPRFRAYVIVDKLTVGANAVR
jgi:hypothetical protein